MSKNSHDSLYRLALEMIIKNDRCSISLMQRNLHVDYDRCAGLIERMETEGIVGSIQSDGQRKILKPEAPGLTALIAIYNISGQHERCQNQSL